jgi:hypothetical protein
MGLFVCIVGGGVFENGNKEENVEEGIGVGGGGQMMMMKSPMELLEKVNSVLELVVAQAREIKVSKVE